MTTQTRSIAHATFVIERTYPFKPERVFAAFARPEIKRRWFAEGDGRNAALHELDFRPGGVERTRTIMGENTPFPGTSLENHTTYLDIVPDKRIVFAYTMSLGDYRMSASLATIEIMPDGQGTRLSFTEQGAYFEGSDGPRMREEGWGKLLDGIGASLAS